MEDDEAAGRVGWWGLAGWRGVMIACSYVMPVGSVKFDYCAVACVYGYLADAHSGNEPAKAK